MVPKIPPTSVNLQNKIDKGKESYLPHARHYVKQEAKTTGIQ
jgi:hypothetical protein